MVVVVVVVVVVLMVILFLFAIQGFDVGVVIIIGRILYPCTISPFAMSFDDQWYWWDGDCKMVMPCQRTSMLRI